MLLSFSYTSYGNILLMQKTFLRHGFWEWGNNFLAWLFFMATWKNEAWSFFCMCIVVLTVFLVTTWDAAVSLKWRGEVWAVSLYHGLRTYIRVSLGIISQDSRHTCMSRTAVSPAPRQELVVKWRHRLQACTSRMIILQTAPGGPCDSVEAASGDTSDRSITLYYTLQP